MRTIQGNILDVRRWLCLFMVFCILFCGIGGIYHRAQALVGVDDALIAVVIAGLAAMGITFASTGAYDSLSDYMGDLITEYAGSRGLTPAGLFTGTQAGANSLGQILLNNRFVTLIEGIAAWLRAKFSLSNNANKVIQGGGEVNGIPVYEFPITVYQTTSGQTTTREAVVVSASGFCNAIIYAYTRSTGNFIGVMAFGDAPFQIRVDRYNSSGDLLTTSTVDGVLFNASYFGDVTSVAKNAYDANSNRNPPYIEGMSATQIKNALDGQEVASDRISIGTGTITLPTEDTNYQTGDGAVIDVSAPWGMTYPDIVGRWIPGEWAPGQTGDPTLAYDTASAIGDQVVTGPDTASVSGDPNEYQVPGLKDVFPFCIPFDVYNFLACLAADPVAPSFTWRFYLPGLCDVNYLVDLSPFDTVAQIVRTMELLAFCAGLAYVTREKFIRG